MNCDRYKYKHNNTIHLINEITQICAIFLAQPWFSFRI